MSRYKDGAASGAFIQSHYPSENNVDVSVKVNTLKWRVWERVRGRPNRLFHYIARNDSRNKVRNWTQDVDVFKVKTLTTDLEPIILERCVALYHVAYSTFRWALERSTSESVDGVIQSLWNSSKQISGYYHSAFDRWMLRPTNQKWAL